MLGELNTFLDMTDRDLRLAEETVQCCSLRHSTSPIVLYFAAFVLVFVLCLFTVLVLVALGQQKTYRPGPVKRDRKLPSWAALPR